jgi:hypothetical protein
MIVWLTVPFAVGPPSGSSATFLPFPRIIAIRGVSKPLARTTSARSSSPSVSSPLTASVRYAPTPSAVRS